VTEDESDPRIARITFTRGHKPNAITFDTPGARPRPGRTRSDDNHPRKDFRCSNLT